jgi:hypothetical protein
MIMSEALPSGLAVVFMVAIRINEYDWDGGGAFIVHGQDKIYHHLGSYLQKWKRK